MSKTYTDYLNKTAITTSETFIDVKTGSNIFFTQKVRKQIEYHTNN
ncbi:hypothetical protein [Bacillus sp. J33]|nr:hypothetical protein [Bacillus sp. J33]